MSTSKFHKGVWLFVESDFKEGPAAVKRCVERLARAGIELMIPCVKVKDGYLDYATKIGLVNPLFAKWDPLEMICREARKKNIQVHPWFCVFHEGEGSKLLRQNKNLRAFIWENGKDAGTWACAMRDEVQDYEFSLYQEVMKQYDVAGVHLDYIRSGCKCVCPYCRQWFRKNIGGDIRKVSINYGNDDFWQWTNWRSANITRFVRRIYREAHQRKKEVSAAVMWHYPACIVDNAQDWGTWAAEGIVDYLFPMNYSSGTRFMEQATRNHIAAVGKKCALWEGLGTWRLMEQMKAVRKMGVHGAVIFQYNALTDEHIRQMARF